ncbi:hypothetical protein H2199_001561 [Coniosporium tulheliwenetii]|uniref:Uncharacterized protein n=1 Tax=Coniosporium tulheliwenetii TaxID=3383036 RepID=A0ACC2ZJN5_9PEZI|nr:hypothetical protein H2199_001561 [Cladosporium sp. JES 115]
MSPEQVSGRLFLCLLALSSMSYVRGQETGERSSASSASKPSSIRPVDPTTTLSASSLHTSSPIISTPASASSLAPRIRFNYSQFDVPWRTSSNARRFVTNPPSPADRNRMLGIIIGAVVGGLLVIAVCTWIWVRVRRSQKRYRRKLFRRAVTPLDDAEFESWRRPSVANSQLEIYGSIQHPPPSHSPKAKPPAPLVVEKDVGTYGPEISRLPQSSPSSGRSRSEKDTDHSRNKSSVSVQDRPPTPYSPTLPPDSFGSSPKSPPNHVHYSSMSSASDFDFGFKDFRGSF